MFKIVVLGGEFLKKDKKEKDKKEKKSKTAESPLKNTTEEQLQPHPAVRTSETDTERDSLEYFSTVVGGKWKLRILWALRQKKGMRYGELKTSVHGITDMMLSQSLCELCSDGLAARAQFQEIPPRVEYSITDEGATMLPAIQLLSEWAKVHMRKNSL